MYNWNRSPRPVKVTSTLVFLNDLHLSLYFLQILLTYFLGFFYFIIEANKINETERVTQICLESAFSIFKTNYKNTSLLIQISFFSGNLKGGFGRMGFCCNCLIFAKMNLFICFHTLSAFRLISAALSPNPPPFTTFLLLIALQSIKQKEQSCQLSGATHKYWARLF